MTKNTIEAGQGLTNVNRSSYVVARDKAKQISKGARDATYTIWYSLDAKISAKV